MKRQNQHGYSGVAIVVAIAVVAVLGFVGWRIYDASSQPKQNAQTQHSNQNNQQAQTDPNAGYIVVTEWGVRFKPANGLADIQYSIGNRVVDVDGTAVFSTAALAQFAESCSAHLDSKAPLGLLTRTTSPQQDFSSASGAFVKKIGTYYYRYMTPQAACTDDLANLPPVPLAAFKASIATLEMAR